MTEVKELINKYGKSFVLFCTEYVEGSMLDAFGAYGILKELPIGQEEDYKKAYKKNVNKCVRDKEKNQKLLKEYEEEMVRQEEERIKNFQNISEENLKKRQRDTKKSKISKLYQLRL